MTEHELNPQQPVQRDKRIEVLQSDDASDKEKQIEFAKIVEQHQGNLIKYAYFFTRSRETAEDLVQEAFIRLWTYIKNYDPEKSRATENAMKFWLMTIVRNLAYKDFKRKKARPQTVNHDPNPSGFDNANVLNAPALDGDPLTRVWFNEVLQALSQLPDEQLQTLTLGVTCSNNDELASALEIERERKITNGNARVMLSRARTAGREALKTSIGLHEIFEPA